MTSPEDIQKQQLQSLNRRNFIRAAGGCGAMSSTAIMSTLLNLKATNAAMSMQGQYDGYKAMVCIFLFGGNDSYNMLIPRGEDEYADYASIRGNPAEGGLSLDREATLPISDEQGREFGLHPELAEIKQLYDDKNCAFVANVGTLVEPTSMSDYTARRNLPKGLFSHADQIREWQTSIPQSRAQATGWAGRMADLVTDETNRNEAISMAISLSGINILETGVNVIPYVVNPSGATTLSGYSSTNAQDRIYRRVTDGMLGQTYEDLLAKTYARSQRTAIDAAIQYNDAVNAVNLQTQFPTSYLGSQLKMIAKTIGSRQILDQDRQIFFVTVGGWDHHSELFNNQAAKFPDLSQSIKAFYDATVELGVSRDVVTYTASDFGRTLTSNGNGSDHAWGGNQFAVGGTVNGGHVYGSYPTSLAAGNELDTGRGRLLPTTSVDEYNADMALWFGIQNDSNLEAVLPNIRNFYSKFEIRPPVGFLGGRRVTPPPGYPGGGGGTPPQPDPPEPELPDNPTSPPTPPGGGFGGGFGGGGIG